ncbi:MAG: discoidin domain-containing protein [Planctomycetaceae bacterium]|nr:discoidin domain-containing protein [Planctomycetaceae bacterium]
MSFCLEILVCRRPHAASFSLACLTTILSFAFPCRAGADPIDLTPAALVTSSAEQPERSPREAVDGDEKTRWAGDNAQPGHWLQLEFSEPRRFSACRLVWEFPDRKYLYRLEASADGKTWQPLVDAAREPRPGREELKFDQAGVRYLRLTHLGNHWPSVRELQLFGDGPLPRPVKAPAIPVGVDPAEEAAILKTLKIPDEFEATLYAAPPTVDCPVFVAAAPDGTLYVSSDRNGSLGRKAKQGRIVRLRDRDGDGHADEAKLFVDDVDSPRGLVVDGDTIYLLHPPHITAYTDHDGDGVADESKIIVKNIGWTFKDRPADHGSNGLELGIDGWLYAAIGDFGFLEAEGTDGRKLQCRGGGVVRMRPDGTGLELYSFGTRNILEVAMSPLLDGFARDNTNDGGGWNIRFHHFTGDDDHGYPRMFKNFADEIVAPLADYGGGSGTGACWIDEPSWPASWNKRPYTVDWGRESIGAHTVVEQGATFIEPNPPAEFARYTRPTDLDVDAHGHAYLGSWRDGGFTAGPNCGYILRVQPKGLKPAALPNYLQATEDVLLTELKSDSHRRRLAAQRELIRRRGQVELNKLLRLAGDERVSLAGRVASLFAFAQSADERNRNSLSPLLRDHRLAAWAIRALTDDDRRLQYVDPRPMIPLLAASDARTRREAVRAVGRIGDSSVAGSLAARLNDDDPIVRHIAVAMLAKLKAVDACLAVLDDAGASTIHRAAAIQALVRIPEARVVSGFSERLTRETTPVRRTQLITALCRLHFVEGTWKGDSWGTRPDTRGPFYQPEPWSETPRIAALLDSVLKQADAAEAIVLGRELARHRIQLGDVVGRLIELAEADPQVVPSLVLYLDREEKVPPAARDLLLKAANSSAADRMTELLAIRSLLKLDDEQAAATILKRLPQFQSTDAEREVYSRVKRNFFLAPQFDRHAPLFFAAAKDSRDAAAKWADGVVIRFAFGAGTAPAVKQTARETIDAAWKTPDGRRRLIAASEFADDRSLAVRIADDAETQDSPTAKFAAETLKRMRLDPKRIREVLDTSGPKVAGTAVPEVVESMKKLRGEPWRGEQLFTQLKCANCHTVRADDPVRGPFLGNIAKTYRREQLAEAILSPSKQLAQGFATNVFTLDSGLTRTGFVTQEAADKVTIRDGTGQELVIAKKEIEEREKVAVSVMPEGLAKDLTLVDLASLLDYLDWLAKQEEQHGQAPQ